MSNDVGRGVESQGRAEKVLLGMTIGREGLVRVLGSSVVPS